MGTISTVKFYEELIFDVVVKEFLEFCEGGE